MSKITRQELSASLRQELDDVYNYINGSNNELFGAHMDARNNPHQVTKAQVGLGNVDDVKQASLTAFNSHTGNQSNPHNVTTAQIGAVPTSRSVETGTGLSGGGNLTSNRTLSLDLNYCDTRYVRKTGGSMNGNLVVSGFLDTATAVRSNIYRTFDSTFMHIQPRQDGEVRITRLGTTSTYESIRAKDFKDPNGNVAYHKGSNIKWGTSNPSGGSDGDIYIQY